MKFSLHILLLFTSFDNKKVIFLVGLFRENLLICVFALIPIQMQATFIDQGLHMNLHTQELHFSLPAAWLNLFDIIVVVILIPIMEKVVYPWIAKYGYNPSPLTRITFGRL